MLPTPEGGGFTARSIIPEAFAAWLSVNGQPGARAVRDPGAGQLAEFGSVTAGTPRGVANRRRTYVSGREPALCLLSYGHIWALQRMDRAHIFRLLLPDRRRRTSFALTYSSKMPRRQGCRRGKRRKKNETQNEVAALSLLYLRRYVERRHAISPPAGVSESSYLASPQTVFCIIPRKSRKVNHEF